MLNVNKIKGKRVELGYTQKALAKRLGMCEKTYIQKEKGKSSFTFDEIINLAKTLDVDLNFFCQ